MDSATGAVSDRHWTDLEAWVSSAARALVRAWATRRDDAWIGLVAVPLAMMATGLKSDWYLWPTLLACSAVATRGWTWSWVLALEMGLLGTAWAFVGAHGLASFPSQRGVVGAIWAAFAAALALASALNRRRL